MGNADTPHDLTKHSRWRKKRWWAIGVLGTLILGLYAVPNFPVGPFFLYSDLSDQQRRTPIPYKVLSDQSTHPFLYGGAGQQFRDAIRKWPTVKSCLVWSERGKTQPDLRLIDWNQFSDTKDAEVCIWRIMSSLNNAAAAHEWMNFHRIWTSGVETTDTYVYPQKYEVYPNSLANVRDGTKVEVLLLQGQRNLEVDGLLFPNKGLSRISARAFVFGQSFTVTWTDKNELLRVDVGMTVK